jgi:phage baseplate assembly protein W
MSTEILSDLNVTGRKAAVVSKRKQYADLDLSLTLHPIFNDIIPLVDIDAVKAAVKNLVLTNFNERPFQPTIGSNLRALLFEPGDIFTIIAIKNGIRDVLKRFEPRVDRVKIQVQDNSDENRYDITVGFRVITLDQPVDLTFYLVRIR